MGETRYYCQWFVDIALKCYIPFSLHFLMQRMRLEHAGRLLVCSSEFVLFPKSDCFRIVEKLVDILHTSFGAEKTDPREFVSYFLLSSPAFIDNMCWKDCETNGGWQDR